MAEAGTELVPVLFDDIFKKLRKLTRDYFNWFLLERFGRENSEKIEATLERFQHMIQKEEVKGFKSEAVKKWLRDLIHIANEAYELLEDALCPNEENLLLPNDEHHLRRLRLPYFSFLTPDRWDFGGRITELIKQFDCLEAEKRILDRGKSNRGTGPTSVLETHVFGRTEAKEKIVSAILKKANVQAGDSPFIYAIIGSSGIGKTTLAQYIYNDKQVVEHFDARIWVWVSESFDVIKVMKKIIHHFEKTNFEDLGTMQRWLEKVLHGKRYLLVLDDIFCEDLDKWNALKSSLNSRASGSSILLTTRQANVASIVGAHDHHNVALSEDLCWHLFRESSALGSSQGNNELEKIGKQIVKNCGGLPIAAKSLGGSLRLKRVVSEWESVRDSHIWETVQSGDIPPALRLSFDLLESHTKHCFAFTSLFPKGYAVNKEDMVHLWMANDLVPSVQGLELEETGNKIVIELIANSFFELSRDCIKMHDLMHDFGRSLRNDCFCLKDPHVTDIPTDVLQLSIDFPYQADSMLSILKTFSKCRASLHTCVLLNGEYIRCAEGNYLQSFLEGTIFRDLDFHCLRVLDLSQTIMEFLDSIEKFKELKYLNLAGTYLTHLPHSICTLTKLQTLKLGGSRRLTRLPGEIAKLTNLRHLDLHGCENLTHLPIGISTMTNLRQLDIGFCSKLTELPNGIGQLVHLQTLGLFIVGQESGRRIIELQALNHLGGSLEIRGLENVSDAKEADKVILKEKNVSSLSLIWGGAKESNNNSDNAESVLEALQPPQSLDGKLVIEGYDGSVFGSWMELLENLVEIELKDCIKCDHLPGLGKLSHLRVLSIVGMKSLTCIGIEFYGSERRNKSSSHEKLKSEGTEVCGSSSSSERRRIFPSLEKLEFANMPILEEWQSSEVNDEQPTLPFPCLKRMKLRKCPRLTSLPYQILSVMQRLEVHNCDNVLVRSLPCLTSLTLFGKNTDDHMSLPFGSLHNLDALKFLEIKCNNYPTYFPDGFLTLTSLGTLRIHSCHKLEYLPKALQHLSSLESLTICSCDQLNLSAWDFSKLVSLRTLQVSHLLKLTDFPRVHNLSKLRRLSICSCKNLRKRPQGMHYLGVLEVLTFANCEQLELSSGDFQGLVNLRLLVLYGLPKLTVIPEVHHVRSLQGLCVTKCKHFLGFPPCEKYFNILPVLWIEKGDCVPAKRLRSLFFMNL